MKISVICIYRFLLCVSVISRYFSRKTVKFLGFYINFLFFSCLLFILVASEAQNSISDTVNLESKNNEINITSQVEISESSGAEEANIPENTNLKTSFDEQTQNIENTNQVFEFETQLSSQNSGVSEG